MARIEDVNINQSPAHRRRYAVQVLKRLTAPGVVQKLDSKNSEFVKSLASTPNLSAKQVAYVVGEATKDALAPNGMPSLLQRYSSLLEQTKPIVEVDAEGKVYESEALPKVPADGLTKDERLEINSLSEDELEAALDAVYESEGMDGIEGSHRYTYMRQRYISLTSGDEVVDEKGTLKGVEQPVEQHWGDTPSDPLFDIEKFKQGIGKQDPFVGGAARVLVSDVDQPMPTSIDDLIVQNESKWVDLGNTNFPPQTLVQGDIAHITTRYTID